MKTKSLGLVFAASMLTMGAANANLLFDIYGGATYGVGGYTVFADGNHVSHSAQSYGAVLGMDIPLFRIELEYNHLDADATNMNIGFVNGYFKIPTPVIKPYIGAGVGYTFSSKYDIAPHVHHDIDDTLAYQGMLGITLNIPVLPFNIDIEGRAVYIPDMVKIDNSTPDLLQYDGRVKLRYVF